VDQLRIFIFDLVPAQKHEVQQLHDTKGGDVLPGITSQSEERVLRNVKSHTESGKLPDN
jgi:hypothetical protein